MTIDNIREQCNHLATKLWLKSATLPKTQKILIGIAGIPGAGKSTVAQLVVDKLNRLAATAAAAAAAATVSPTNTSSTASSSFAVNVPMDGFHYTRAQLRAMPDPAIAAHRRGAAFTYDAERYVTFIQELRAPAHACAPQHATSILAPSFDHAVKDPVEGQIEIGLASRIVIVEGNYCALKREPWMSAARLMDEIWFVEVDREVARTRLARRHVQSGICRDLEDAHERIRSTDFLNADDIELNSLPPDEIVDG